MKKEIKDTIIAELGEKLKEYPHFYLVDLAGLNAEATSNLRRKCFKNEIKMTVVKNNLLREAFQACEHDFEPMYGALKGTTAVMFCHTANVPAKLLKEYKKEGINFFCMTVQNEPKASQKWQSCLYSGKEEGEYAVDFLKPHLDKAGFDTLKLIVWDHNKERVLERASESFAVPKARKAIWGVAFHWYSGKHFDQLRMTHERFPEKHLILSEFCKGPATGGTHVPYGDWSDAEDYCAEMIGDFNNYACASIDWNMIVDTKGGPCLYRDDIGGGKASVVADAENNSFELQSTYYAVGHFSKYVKRGARRIGNSTYDDNLLTSSFKNPDGSIAVIVLNKGNNNLRPLLRMNRKIMRLNLPRHSITTVSIKSKGAK